MALFTVSGGNRTTPVGARNGHMKRSSGDRSFLTSPIGIFIIFIIMVFVATNILFLGAILTGRIDKLIVKRGVADFEKFAEKTAGKTNLVSFDDNKNDDGDNKSSKKKKPEVKKKNHENGSSSSSSSSSSGTNKHAKIHVIISTGCSTKQDFQSYVFFHSALKAGQKGHVTRIASGCKDGEAEILKKYHEDYIETMAPGRFHLHLTPDYSNVKPGANYKYFNKPCGVLHWLENELGYPNPTEEIDDTVIVLCDPDMILKRPFTNDFTDSIEEWKEPRKTHPIGTIVKHGYPFAQQYGFAIQWKEKTDISKFSKPEESPSPVLSMSHDEAFENYSAGPPYMATGRDFYKIVSKWAEFVPHVHTQYPNLLAEMFAYSLAAAHLQMPHQIAHSFMLSDVTSGGEAWKTLIAPFSDVDTCLNVPEPYLPHVIHYCHTQVLGKYFIGKHRVPKNFISCEQAMFQPPPKNIATMYDYGIKPDKDHTKITIKKKNVPRTAFLLCYVIQGLNDAARYFKANHCPNDSTTNNDETFVFHDDMTIHG